MNVNVAWPDKGQWIALGRHAVSYSAGAATGAAGLLAFATVTHLISADQAGQITGALKDLGTGISSVVSGIGTIYGALATLLSVFMGIWAMFSSSKPQQAASVVTVPGTTIVTTPSLAAAVPSDKVVSNTAVDVVPK